MVFCCCMFCLNTRDGTCFNCIICVIDELSKERALLVFVCGYISKNFMARNEAQSQWVAMDSLPKLLPSWHDVALQDLIRRKSLSRLQCLKPPDQGGIGLDISCGNNMLQCESSKHPEKHIKFESDCCALPFMPLSKIDSSADPCLESLKKEKFEFDLFCKKFGLVRKSASSKRYLLDLKNLRLKIKRVCDSKKDTDKIDVRASKVLVDLAELKPKRVAIPTFNVSYAGGTLSVCKVSNRTSLLHPISEAQDKICITPLHDDSERYFKADLSKQIIINLKPQPILQVESAVNEFCCIRQKNSFHLLNLKNMELHSKKLKKSVLYHIAPSPYNPLDILTVYEKGELKLRNMLTRKTVWSHSEDSFYDPGLLYPTWRCSFGSHPFSALCLNERKICCFDFRSKDCGTKEIFNVMNSSFYMSEELVALKQWNRNPFQYFVASNHHLIICDERYPKKPVLYWNHNMIDYPIYCDIANFKNSSNSVVVLGTQELQELSAFVTHPSEINIQPISSSYPLSLSSPSDCIDSLKLHCHNVDDEFSLRLSYPLCGVCVLPHSKEMAFTAFQQTSVGDIFFQNFKQTFSDIAEKTYRVTTGCVLTPPEKILPHIKEYISNSDTKGDSLEQNDCADEAFSRLQINLTKILNPPKEISANCSLCRLNTDSDKKELTFSEICPTCNLSSAESELFTKSYASTSVLIGPTSEESSTLDCDIDYLSKFNDMYSKRILSVWIESDDIDDALSQYSFNDENLEATPSMSSFYSFSDGQSDYSTYQDESMALSADSQMSVETSFNESALSFSQELIPPSQEVRPLIGETLYTPKRTKSSENVVKNLTAGFNMTPTAEGF